LNVKPFFEKNQSIDKAYSSINLIKKKLHFSLECVFAFTAYKGRRGETACRAGQKQD
jgi:hypothetical protein